MLHFISIFLASFSLVLFCMGLNFYTNLHLGYEFLTNVIALEVASFLFAVAICNQLKDLSINMLSLMTLWLLIVAGYLLTVYSYVTITSYFIALLCVILPVVLIGMLIIYNRGDVPMVKVLPVIFAGSIAGIFVSFLVVKEWGIWGTFMLSMAALTMMTLLHMKVSSYIKLSSLFLFVGVLFFINHNGMKDQLANWLLFDKPVTKQSLNLLHDPGANGLSLTGNEWENGNRVDKVTTERSRHDGSFWTIHNANVVVPHMQVKNSSLSWWDKQFPLMTLPFKLIEPTKVLTVSAVRGPDTYYSDQLNGLATTSVYADCLPLDNSACDDSALNVKLATALESSERYDLISFSNFNLPVTPFVSAAAPYESVHTLEVFQKLYDSLDDGGLMVINSRDQVMLHKALSYVWRLLSDSSDDKIIEYKDHIRVLMLSKYSLKNDAYNYVVLLSKDAFKPELIQELDRFIQSSPVEKAIYDSWNNIPPYIFFKQLNNITVSSAISHLTTVSSWKYKKLLGLEPSSVTKPDYFHLSRELHPFISVLSAIFISLALVGLIFSHRSMRSLDSAKVEGAPVLAILLLQTFLCSVASVLLIYPVLTLVSSSLGYSVVHIIILMLLTVLFFTVPHAFTGRDSVLSKGTASIGIYFFILILGVSVTTYMLQDIDFLLGAGSYTVAMLLVVFISFSTGQVHYQSSLFLDQCYPGVTFWFWGLTAVGVVLGGILAKYILIEYDLVVQVRVAMAMFLFMSAIAWWCVSVIQGKSNIRL